MLLVLYRIVLITETLHILICRHAVVQSQLASTMNIIIADRIIEYINDLKTFKDNHNHVQISFRSITKVIIFYFNSISFKKTLFHRLCTIKFAMNYQLGCRIIKHTSYTVGFI